MVLISVGYGCDPRYGFIESEFQLASESRLPGFAMPSGYTRKDISITFTFYTHPFLKKVRVVVLGPSIEHSVLMDKIGTQRDHPLTEDQEYDVYPQYTIITVDGIEEVFEHRRLEPFIYVTDDPKLRADIR